MGGSPAGRRPNRGCGPRAAAEAARHNVTKSHRLRTYRDAGRAWASGAASRSFRGASTSRCHWSRTRKESWASRGPEEQVQFRGTDNADVAHGGANRFILDSDCRSLVRIVIKYVISPLAVAAECALQERDSNIVIDLTETIKEETVNHHLSSMDQTCV
jgi:hypothetical protein